MLVGQVIFLCLLLRSIRLSKMLNKRLRRRHSFTTPKSWFLSRLHYTRGQGNIHFSCSADHEQDWQPYPVDPYSAICDDHTYIHTRYKLQQTAFSGVLKKKSPFFRPIQNKITQVVRVIVYNSSSMYFQLLIPPKRFDIFPP